MSLETKGELLDRLCTILGGRVAEELFFGRVIFLFEIYKIIKIS